MSRIARERPRRSSARPKENAVAASATKPVTPSSTTRRWSPTSVVTTGRHTSWLPEPPATGSRAGGKQADMAHSARPGGCRRHGRACAPARRIRNGVRARGCAIRLRRGHTDRATSRGDHPVAQCAEQDVMTLPVGRRAAQRRQNAPPMDRAMGGVIQKKRRALGSPSCGGARTPVEPRPSGGSPPRQHDAGRPAQEVPQPGAIESHIPPNARGRRRPAGRGTGCRTVRDSADDRHPGSSRR